ncbi:trypsin-like peptidase domain-containing protein [Streptomyces sp. NPDC051840]|uniref:trypsin-like peptidase domain-containing protein n=1 Tax=unclassified Streptomyces TaxID=2593676 RepID=UPI0034249BEB
MDDGKPSGPKAKWWSRPSAAERNRPAGPEHTSAPSGAASTPVVAPAGGGEPAESPAPSARPADGDGPGVAPTAQRTHMTADGDFTPAPPAPARPQAEPETSPDPGPVGSSPDPGPVGSPPDPGPVGSPPGHRPVAEAAPTAQEPLATEPGTTRARPLHAPDEYSTPPYGGPGPWAPAPPVQRPVPTPAHGTAVPPPYAGTDGHGAPAQGFHGHPADGRTGPYAQAAHTVPQQPSGGHPAAPVPPAQENHQHGASQWPRYDPWSAQQQPLSHHGQGPDARPRRSRRGAALAGAALLALVAGGIGGGIGAYVERNGGLTTVELPQSAKDDGGRAPDSVAGIAASALPSVVTLHVSGSAESGTGTGFVLDDRGHILTNNHVVAPAGDSGDITVTFSGGESAPAEIVGKDSGYDLAVVKVSGVSGLKPLPLGNSDNVRVGDPVVAIGAPFDLSNTVTSGIISAKQRPITAGGEKGDGSDVSYVDALQTDAPINPGNSGGPLVDTEARVIGINSAIRAADSAAGSEGGQSGSIGLGFAIPINQGKRVAEELINTGKATHPVIGVTLDMEFTGDGAKVGGASAGGGRAVTEGGPADKAGIREGDVITEVEGGRVHSGEELIVKIRAHRPGDRLELVLTRGGRELSMTLTLGSASGT